MTRRRLIAAPTPYPVPLPPPQLRIVSPRVGRCIADSAIERFKQGASILDVAEAEWCPISEVEDVLRDELLVDTREESEALNDAERALEREQEALEAAQAQLKDEQRRLHSYGEKIEALGSDYELIREVAGLIDDEPRAARLMAVAAKVERLTNLHFSGI